MIDKGQWREFGRDTGVTPQLFTRSAMGFLMTTECQDLSLTSHLKDGREHPRCSETQEVQASCRLGGKSYTFRSSVHCEPEFKAIWMPRLNLLQVILQQNVLLSLGDRRNVNRFILYLPRSSICLNIIYLRLWANQKRDSTHTHKSAITPFLTEHQPGLQTAGCMSLSHLGFWWCHESAATMA